MSIFIVSPPLQHITCFPPCSHANDCDTQITYYCASFSIKLFKLLLVFVNYLGLLNVIVIVNDVKFVYLSSFYATLYAYFEQDAQEGSCLLHEEFVI